MRDRHAAEIKCLSPRRVVCDQDYVTLTYVCLCDEDLIRSEKGALHPIITFPKRFGPPNAWSSTPRVVWMNDPVGKVRETVYESLISFILALHARGASRAHNSCKFIY